MSKYLTKIEKQKVIDFIEDMPIIDTCRLICVNGGYSVVVSPEINTDYAFSLGNEINIKNFSLSIVEKMLFVINESRTDEYIYFWKKPYNLVDGKKEYWS